MTKTEMRALYNKARAAGDAAATKTTPVPMTVYETNGVLDDAPRPGGRRWYVSEGVCGFAWVTIRPGTSAFARWLKANDLARTAYGGGVSVWVGDYGQSLDRKEAYAHAFAKTLRDAGISAWAESRLD